MSILTKISDEILSAQVLANSQFVVYLKELYGYSNLQYDCVRSSASGEMGNMFTVIRQYHIRSEVWRDTLDQMKLENEKHFKHFYSEVRRLWHFEKEKHSRWWKQRFPSVTDGKQINALEESKKEEKEKTNRPSTSLAV